MVLEYGILFGVGILFVVLGLLLWKKQKITILHDYHYKNVKKEDVSAYTRLMGIGQIVIGVGLCLTGLLMLITQSQAVWTVFVLGMVIGLILMHRTQMRYNGSWFS